MTIQTTLTTPGTLNMGSAPPSPRPTLFRIAVLLSLALLWAIAATAVLRSGLADSGMFLAAIAAFGLASIWLPFLALSTQTGDATPSFGVASAALVIGPILPVLGLGMGVAATGLAAASVAYAGVRHRKSIAQVLSGRGDLLRLFGGSLLLAGFIVTSGAPWRLYVPEAISLGVAQADSYFHVAIAQMIAAFRIPSSGGDGLALQRYHFGSHIVAAGLADAGASRASLVYVYWGLIVLKVQLLWALLWGSLVLARSADRPTRTFPLLAYAMAFLLLGPLESESFMLGMAVFAGAAPLMCSLFTRNDLDTWSYRFGLLTILIAAFICATAKVSVGYFCGVTLGWMLWRGRANRLNALLLLAGLAALGAYTISLVLPFEQSLAASGVGILIGSYAQYATLVTLLSYALPCIVLWAYFHDLRMTGDCGDAGDGSRTGVNLQFSRARNGQGMYQRLVSSAGLMQLHALCLASCVLALLTVPIGSGMAYFSYVLLFLPALARPAWLLAAYVSAREVRRAVLGIGLLCGVYLTVAFAATLAHTISMLTRSVQDQTAAAFRDVNAGAGLGRRVIEKSLRQSGTLFGHFRSQLEHTAWANMLNRIKAARIGSDLQVFASPSAEEFWTRLGPGRGNPYWCLQPHLMIPAELGMPMIRGIAPLKYEAGCSAIAGLYGFGKYQDAHRTADLSDQQLCSIAKARDLDGIYVLNAISAVEGNRVLLCTENKVHGVR